MGIWGVNPWDSDAAADWFASFFEGFDIDARLADAFDAPDDYEVIRAACYILQVLGQSYVWPGDLDRLDVYLARGIELLTAMIDPETGQAFLALWQGEPAVVAAIAQQIAALTALLPDEGEMDEYDEEAGDDGA